ncbi:unnamed protein product, partial [Meganyctiphanes norvegica]
MPALNSRLSQSADFEGPIGGELNHGMQSSTSMDRLRESFMRKVRRKDSGRHVKSFAGDHIVSSNDVTSPTFPREIFPDTDSSNIQKSKSSFEPLPKSTSYQSSLGKSASVDNFKERFMRFMGSRNDVSDHDTPRTLQKVKEVLEETAKQEEAKKNRENFKDKLRKKFKFMGSNYDVEEAEKEEFRNKLKSMGLKIDGKDVENPEMVENTKEINEGKCKQKDVKTNEIYKENLLNCAKLKGSKNDIIDKEVK